MKKILLITVILVSGFLSRAQETMYMMRDGAIVGQHTVSEVDSLIFYEPSSDPVAVSSITLSGPTTYYVGDNIDFSAYLNVSPSNATDKSVTWSSNGAAVSITNASTGAATASTAGSAVITASANDGSGVSNTITITVSAETPNAYYEGYIPNAKYIGRWTRQSTTGWPVAEVDRCYYTGAQIKVNFTGTTAKINIPNGTSNVNFFVKIDDGNWYYPGSFTGEVNLTPTPLAPGEHSLWIASGMPKASGAGHYIMSQNLILDPGAETRPPSISSKHIEFVGDSISTITYGDDHVGQHWNWLIGEATGWEHTHVAWPGGNFGVIDSYDKIGGSDWATGGQEPWNFSLYTPDAVVVNLGQNGGGTQAQYEYTIDTMRGFYPDAEIFIIGLFSGQGSSAANAEAAVNVKRNAGDSKVHYLGEGIGGTGGGDVHPSPEQSANIASSLIPPIKAVLGIN